MSKTLYLIRGLPGSGKTTLAMAMVEAGMGCAYAADDFFTDDDGVYRYIPSSISAAHNWCQRQVMEDMLDGEGVIIVHNTFSRLWEMEWYVNEAAMQEYNVCLITVEGDYPGGKWTGKEGLRQQLRTRMSERWETYSN